ncbi:hypothetical protein BV25DRAFT_1816265 [Artomyces pyxidatus]|uniref:Uncharacterized protein n=1 Tax=Artomyces pyxidatus TaxID=48021 RepID=A0ACB8SFE9_9AGAM|nr:hypothetical protein BV25DRAFT_1816265 [Artomyces pyxidatus]
MGQGVGFFDDLIYNERVAVSELAISLAEKINSETARQLEEADEFLGNLSREQTMSEAAPSTRTLYSEDNEVHVAQYLEQYPIHEEILLLAKHGVRLPLTVFTNDALCKITQNPMSFRKKISVETGSACLLDTSAFGLEDDLSQHQWTEAWRAYKAFLSTPGIATEGVHDRWYRHYEAITGVEDFEANFRAVRTFDIEERVCYHSQPFKHNEAIYWRAYDKICTGIALADLQEEKEARERQASGSALCERRHTTSSISRFHPYDDQHPRQSGKPSTGLCLVCGTTGHHVRDCSARVSIKGRPLVAKWDISKRTIVTISGNGEFCVYWNLKGPGGCHGEHGTRSRHACSICTGDHHAASGACPASD